MVNKPVTACLLAIATLLAFFAYLTTTAPTITWYHYGIDTGEWATAAAQWTIPHPSGYPLYLLLGRLFAELPFGSLAHRLNLMSAVFGALTVGMVAWTVYAGLRRLEVQAWVRPLGAMIGAGLLAFSPVFWSQAVLAEVYTLHCFGIATLMRLLVTWESEPRCRWLLVFLGLAFGLAMDNHTTTFLFAPAIALFLAQDYLADGRLDVRRALKEGSLVVVVATLALAPYLLLLVRGAQGAYPTLWDTSTPSALIDHFSGGAFRGLLFIFPFETVLSRLSAVPKLLLQQFTPVGIAAIAAGVWALLQYDVRFFRFVIIAAALNIFFAINYPVFDSELYLLPIYMLAAPLAGWGVIAGLQAAVAYAAGSIRRPARWLPAILIGLFLGAVSSQYLLYRPTIDVSQDHFAYQFIKSILDELPPDTVLISGSPEEVLGLWYLQYGENYRQDVLVIDAFWSYMGSYRRNLSRQFDGQVPPPDTPSNYLRGVVQRNMGVHPVLATSRATSWLDDENISYTDLGTGILEIHPLTLSTNLPR